MTKRSKRRKRVKAVTGWERPLLGPGKATAYYQALAAAGEKSRDGYRIKASPQAVLKKAGLSPQGWRSLKAKGVLLGERGRWVLSRTAPAVVAAKRLQSDAGKRVSSDEFRAKALAAVASEVKAREESIRRLQERIAESEAILAKHQQMFLAAEAALETAKTIQSKVEAVS